MKTFLPGSFTALGQSQKLRSNMDSSSGPSIRILTHNVRYATTAPFPGEEVWEVREPRIISELRYNTRHWPEAFICLQEVLHHQLQDILSGLNQPSTFSRQGHRGAEWAYIGVGRDDGKQGGEYSPIFYRPAVWDVDRWKTVWLSPSPDRPSKGWDAASIRILTMATFKHRPSSRRVLAMNTHLDDQGARSRFEGARMIVEEIDQELRLAGELRPVFLAGDLNSEEGDDAYRRLNDDASLIQNLRECIGPEERYGNKNTFTGFGHDGEPSKRIDFIFLGPRRPPSKASAAGSGSKAALLAWRPLGYSVLANRFDDGVYNSDHRAVVGDALLE